MRKSILGLSALALLASATPSFAQEAEAASSITITGSAALVSDYRFRGFSQSSENAAVQAGITATHSSGFYVGTWGSSINLVSVAPDESVADLPTEIDIFAGYSTKVAEGLTVDVGLLYYLYPKHGGGDTDFFEPYVNLIGAVGPATIKVGANYAWSQSALGDNSAIYFHAEPSIAIPGTPLGLNAHLGYAKSDAFPGGADGKVWDYSIGATATYKMLTFGVSYVDTDERSVFAEPAGSDGAVVFSLTAAF